MALKSASPLKARELPESGLAKRANAAPDEIRLLHQQLIRSTDSDLCHPRVLEGRRHCRLDFCAVLAYLAPHGLPQRSLNEASRSPVGRRNAI